MTLSVTASAPAATVCDALLVAVAPGKGKSLTLLSQGFSSAQQARILESLEAVGASGKSGDVAKIPGGGGIKASLIVAVGLGDSKKQDEDEAVRRAYGNAVRALTGRAKIAIVAPKDDAQFRAIATGARLAAYEFVSFKSKKAKASAPAASIALLVPRSVSAAERRIVGEVNVIVDAMNLTRDLVNTPPNALPPVALAKAATEAVASLPVKVTIWDVPALKRARCGGILGVGQGSSNPPRLVKLVYTPRGATAHLALVGKGITFDTGGISIKPAANMDEMKGDMAGAAAVIAAVQAIATLGIKVKVTGWLAIAENMPSSTAQRPGDVITMFDGTTVEVLNTDAEGRLVLADALGMAVKEKPDLLIDVATLTGAQSVALGRRVSGVMSNDDDARDQVCAAAAEAGESMWPMPLPEDLRAALDSSTADIANIGDRMGGMLSAGVFLSTFIPEGQPWVHLDIAGPAFNDKGAYGYLQKGGTGASVRTFVRIAQTIAAG
jgi:leucyl aminopeptidase